MCDCRKTTVSGIEAGKNLPCFDLIYGLADTLEIHPANSFLRNTSKPHEDIRKFFDAKLRAKTQEMEENQFPLLNMENWRVKLQIARIFYAGGASVKSGKSAAAAHRSLTSTSLKTSPHIVNMRSLCIKLRLTTNLFLRGGKPSTRLSL